MGGGCSHAVSRLPVLRHDRREAEVRREHRQSVCGTSIPTSLGLGSAWAVLRDESAIYGKILATIYLLT
jgi:hypothetical protein